jgi:branched-chain amino acid transport system substrate-binding protein
MRRVLRVAKLLGFVSAVVLTCGAAVSLVGGSKAVAASDEVTILGLWPFSGPYADVGPLLDRGAKVALEEAGYKAAGKKIKYITRDSETKAGTAARRVQEAVEGEGAQFVAGPWSSGVGLAVAEVALKNKVMHLFSGGTEDISGKRCNRYAFQWAANPWTAMEANLRMFKKNNPSAQSIYLFVADYAFGWSLQKYVEQLAPKYGLKVAGADRHPLGHREFSSYITKAVAANPDAIFMINFGTDAVTALRQIYNFGFTPKKPVIMSWSSGTEELVQLDPEMRANLQVGTNYYWTIDNAQNKKFVEEYEKASNGVAPGYAPAAGYGMMKSILIGIESAKSTEPQKAIQALETFKGDTFVGPTTVNAKTHQIERPYFILKTKPKDQMKNENDLAEIIDVSAKPQPPELNECKDIGGF